MTTTNTSATYQPDTFDIFASIQHVKESKAKGGRRFIFLIFDLKSHEYYPVSAYVKDGYTKMMNYYRNKKYHDLVAIEATKHEFNGNTYINIWHMYSRGNADRNRQKKAQQQQAQSQPQTATADNSQVSQEDADQIAADVSFELF